MKNKELQEQRMRGYFLQATKELLKGEGLKSISVRSIADKAGYSFATMYSYFKDVNDLVFLCVHDFQEEAKQFVKEQIKKKEKGIKSLRAAIRAYADFFIQYPGIFDLFFIEKIGDIKGKKPVLDTIQYSLDSVCEEEWNYCLSKGLISVENAELLKSQLRYTVTGLLTLYLNRRTPPSYTEFVNLLNQQLDIVLEPGSGKVAAGSAKSSGGAVTLQEGSMAVNNSLISIKIGNNR
ncbi:TetR/AcrR family transcriptional regulator [Flavitalea flava]